MAAEIKYRVNDSNDVWLTDDVYHWNLPYTTLSMLWVDVIANGDINIVEQKNEDWCRYLGRDDKGDFYRYWFTFISNSGYERRNEYEFSTTVGDETASFTIKIRQKGTLETPTVSDNLNRIIQAKADIKQAIENKGVIVGDMTIDNYAEKINEIKGSKWVMPNGTQFYLSTFTEFDASLVDVSNNTDMSYMFAQCHNLTNINGLETWDVSKVNNMFGMFEHCELIEFLDLSGWDISNVTDIRSMFNGCKKLNTIKGIENLNTSNVTEMRFVFSNCEYLRKIDLSNWDTSKVTNMRNMFAQCTRLTELKMGGDVSNVTDVTEMFYLIKTTGTFYYNPAYDYSKIIAKLPSTWTAVPME